MVAYTPYTTQPAHQALETFALAQTVGCKPQTRPEVVREGVLWIAQTHSGLGPSLFCPVWGCPPWGSGTT